MHSQYGLPDVKSKDCLFCPLGNVQNKKGPDDGHRHWSYPLQGLVIDSFGPVTPADPFGNQYVMMVTDLCTRYKWCIPFARPSQWRALLDKQLREASSLHNTKIGQLIIDKTASKVTVGVVRTDNEPTLVGKEADKYFDSQGIKHERTAPRHHYQGGLAEQVHDPNARHVITIMAAANVPRAFYSFAMQQLVHIDNLRKRPNGYCPKQLFLSHLAPEKEGDMLSRLRVMFCLGWAKISPEVRTKLQLRSTASVYMGLADHLGVKAHLWLTLDKGVLIISEYGTWDEARFPFQDRRVWEHFGYPWDEHGYELQFPDCTKQCGVLEAKSDDESTAANDGQGNTDLPTSFLGMTDVMLFPINDGHEEITEDEPIVKHPSIAGHGVPLITPVDNPELRDELQLPLTIASHDLDSDNEMTLDGVGGPIATTRRKTRAADTRSSVNHSGSDGDSDSDTIDGKKHWGYTKIFAPYHSAPLNHWRLPCDDDGEPIADADPEFWVRVQWDDGTRSWEPWSGVASSELAIEYAAKYHSRLTAIHKKITSSAKGGVIYTPIPFGSDGKPVKHHAQAAVSRKARKMADRHAQQDARAAAYEHTVRTAIAARYTAFAAQHANEPAELNPDFVDDDAMHPDTKRYTAHKTPTTYPEAMASPFWPQWEEAIVKELMGMWSQGVWTEVPKATVRAPPINVKWVFKIKFDADGALDKFKARLVAKGFSQKDGVNFDSSQTYSPVISLPIARMLMAIFAGNDDVHWEHWDVSQAFLWAKLDSTKQPIYLRPIPGMNVSADKLLLLHRTIYGLKQSSAEYFKLAKATILAQGFVQSEYEECLFIKRDGDKWTIMLLYVDDFIVFTNDKPGSADLLLQLNKHFKTTDSGGLKHFLNISVTRNSGGRYVDLCQEQSILELGRDFNLHTTTMRRVRSPIGKERYSKDQGGKASNASDEIMTQIIEFEFRSPMGRVGYFVSCTRPDVLYAFKILAQFLNDPGMPHIHAVMRVIRYLVGTANQPLRLHAPASAQDLLAYVGDSDDANNEDHRRSLATVFGYIGVFDPERPMSMGCWYWKNFWTPWVTSSSCESEMHPAALATKHAMYIRPLLSEIGFAQQNPTPVIADSRSTIIISKSDHPGRHKGTKHVERRLFVTQQAQLAGIINMIHCSSEDNPADLGSTFKSIANFETLRTMVMGHEFKQEPMSIAFIDDDTDRSADGNTSQGQLDAKNKYGKRYNGDVTGDGAEGDSPRDPWQGGSRWRTSTQSATRDRSGKEEADDESQPSDTANDGPARVAADDDTHQDTAATT